MGRITGKDKWELVKGDFLCFHCRQRIKEETIVYEISQKNSTLGYREPMVFENNTQYKRILFHPDCFEEIAGEDYMFSEDD